MVRKNLLRRSIIRARTCSVSKSLSGWIEVKGLSSMTDDNKDTKSKPVTIKKYANRRLYNTSTSSYVTLDDLATMIKNDIDFTVYDAKTKDDITHSVLTHIIMEQESMGQSLLPVSFLRHLISFYGDSLESVVPNYLEQSMHSFANNQDKMRAYMQESFGSMSPFSKFEDVGKQNLAMFESAMNMFTPFAGKSNANSSPPEDEKAAVPANPSPAGTSGDDLAALRDQIDAMQAQLDKISKD